MKPDDTTLVHQCLHGDQNAFGELVHRYEHAAFGLALSYTRDFTASEDLAQEAFISAYRNLSGLREPSKFGPWLKQMVVNMCLNHQRKRQAEKTALQKAETEIRLDKSSDPLPDQRYESRDFRVRVLQAIERLSDDNREAVTLYYINGLSAEEIGHFLDVSPNAINQRLHRARAQLKQEMIAMVEDVLKSSHPQQFPEKVLQKIAERAREARKNHQSLDAVQHYNQALDILEDLTETDQQKRWKADMLWEKSNAARFLKWDNKKEIIPDLEAALELEKGLGNPQQYAQRLSHLALYYANARMALKSLQTYQEASAIFESLGDLAGQAWCLYWMARHYIPYFDEEKDIETSYVQSLEGFRRAAALYRQSDKPWEEALSLAAIKLLETLGEHPDKARLQSISSGVSGIQKSPEVLTWGGAFGGGFVYTAEGGPDKRPLHYAIAYFLRPSEIIAFPIQIGEPRSHRTFAYGMQEMKATTTVKRLNATAVTKAGTFQNCLELETAFEITGEEPSEKFRMLNRQNAGTRHIYFAPGVGPVKLVYHHGDDVITNVQLLECNIPERTDAYFPLQLNARWRYEIANTHTSYVIHDTNWIAAQDGNTSCIATFHHSV